MRNEISSLTSLRGMAAWLVVLYHFRDQFGDALVIDRYTAFFSLGYLWVDFFFVLSGFVLTYVYADAFRGGVHINSYVQFTLRRLGRVLPLHLFILACFIPTELVKFATPANAYPPFSVNTPFSVLTNILLIHAWNLHPQPTWNHPSWSISAEFAAYLLFPFLAVFVSRCRAIARFALVVCAFGVLIWITLGPGHGTLDVTAHDGVPRCLPSFTLGMLIARWHAAPASPLKQLIGSDVVLGAILGAIVVMLHFALNQVLVVAGFCALVASASFNHGFFARTLAAGPLHWLGKVSYSIYLTHGLVQRTWQFVFFTVFHSHMTTCVALVMLGILLATVLAASWLTCRLIEMPGRRIFNSLAARWRSPVAVATG